MADPGVVLELLVLMSKTASLLLPAAASTLRCKVSKHKKLK